MTALALAVIALAGCQSEPPDHSYCGISRTGYDNALAEVRHRLSAYSSCVGRLGGSGSCGAEFDALGSAQSNLGRAAGDVQQYCAASP